MGNKATKGSKKPDGGCKLIGIKQLPADDDYNNDTDHHGNEKADVNERSGVCVNTNGSDSHHSHTWNGNYEGSTVEPSDIVIRDENTTRSVVKTDENESAVGDVNGIKASGREEVFYGETKQVPRVVVDEPVEEVSSDDKLNEADFVTRETVDEVESAIQYSVPKDINVNEVDEDSVSKEATFETQVTHSQTNSVDDQARETSDTQYINDTSMADTNDDRHSENSTNKIVMEDTNISSTTKSELTLELTSTTPDDGLYEFAVTFTRDTITRAMMQLRDAIENENGTENSNDILDNETSIEIQPETTEPVESQPLPEVVVSSSDSIDPVDEQSIKESEENFESSITGNRVPQFSPSSQQEFYDHLTDSIFTEAVISFFISQIRSHVPVMVNVDDWTEVLFQWAAVSQLDAPLLLGFTTSTNLQKISEKIADIRTKHGTVGHLLEWVTRVSLS